jgi:hypothetical protein
VAAGATGVAPGGVVEAGTSGTVVIEAGISGTVVIGAGISGTVVIGARVVGTGISRAALCSSQGLTVRATGSAGGAAGAKMTVTSPAARLAVPSSVVPSRAIADSEAVVRTRRSSFSER